MAIDDRVQLKREEVVGNDVVLSDINPKTNTNSIDDSVTGDSLNKIIERLWNAINNKLSRIVNSVNGRTGVVVLDASDVGLENVDNVSLADIKKWVIERTIQEFHNKRIELFDSLEDVDDALTQWNDDEAFVDKPYYSHHGYKRDGDMRGYIGYIYQDPATGKLQHTFDMVIDTVGWTDNSIIYNENLDENRDFHGGGIGVNIWKYEEALQLYNDAGGKELSGLRIDGTKIRPNVYFFDGVYGNGDPNDQDALLYFDRDTIPNPLPKTVTIKIDGQDMTYVKPIDMTPGIVTKLESGDPNFIRQSFKIGDIIICNFSSDKYATKTEYSIELIHKYMNPLLMFRNTAIGQVTQAPTTENPETNYTIEFYSIRHNIYRGLKEYDVNTKVALTKSGKALGVSLLEADKRPADFPKGFNISGINALEPYNRDYSKTKTTGKPERAVKIITPMGPESISVSDTSSAMYISPNYSMCTFPGELYNSNYVDGRPLENWPTSVPIEGSDPNMTYDFELKSYLGINLMKSFVRADKRAINLSGLRINSSDTVLNNDWFGRPDYEENPLMTHSGGLSVNVGSFLEITSESKYPIEEQTVENYYDDGKVNVRINRTKSLYDAGDNSIGIRLIHHASNSQPAGGLIHTLVDDGKSDEYGLSINRGMGLKFSKYNSIGREISDDDPPTVGINIRDTLNEKDHLDQWGVYGGLRFINDDGSYGSMLSVRVNENDTCFGSDINAHKGKLGFGKDYHNGTEGLRITDKNVLGIQLQSDGLNIDEYGNSDNPLYIKSNEEWLISAFYRKSNPPKKMITVSGSLDSVVLPDPDNIYLHHDIDGKEYYFYHIENEVGKWVKILNYYDKFEDLPGNTDEDASVTDKLFIIHHELDSNKIKVLKWVGSQYEELSDWFNQPTTGLKLEYNNNKGLYTETSDLFNIRKLAINIYDKSSSNNDTRTFDSKYLGGLRFSHNGTIAIRLNRNDDNNTIGSKGLCIDDDNVLGIKIDKSKSDLEFDSEGNLTISKDFKKEQQPLTFTSGDKSITYNGNESIVIELGPGLKLLNYDQIKEDIISTLQGDELTSWHKWLIDRRYYTKNTSSASVTHVINFFKKLTNDVVSGNMSDDDLDELYNIIDDVMSQAFPTDDTWSEEIWLHWTLDEILSISQKFIQHLNDFEPEKYNTDIINYCNEVYNVDLSDKTVDEVIEYYTNGNMPLPALVIFLDKNLELIYSLGLKTKSSASDGE